MPRSARLDVPNVIQHVMARGIEGRPVFRDAKDCREFVRRLGEVMLDGGGRLFAWCLMSNHFHLVLTPTRASLASLMRRLMTGYAVWHNRRHERRGHLFQNRYKSIVVEEEPYFLGLIRYVHLNAVRAGMAPTMEALDAYPWSGHRVLLGKVAYPAQDVDAVLERFGRRVGEARRAYRQFVQDGLGEGARREFRGGGLVRSAGGMEALAGRRPEERQAGDERVLGSGAFVEELWAREGREGRRVECSAEEVLENIARRWDVAPLEILSGSRERRVSRARREFFRRAHEEAGQSMAALARMAGLTQPSVWQAIRKSRSESAAESDSYES
jgi:putative transposase